MNFCLSTEMIDLHNQAPNRNQRECKYYWDEVCTLICGAGFKDIEIPYEPKWDFGGRSGIPRTLRSITTKFGTVSQYMEILKHIGIDKISCIHLDPSMFCSGSMDMYFGAMEHFAREAIDFCEMAKVPVFTLTATPPIATVRALVGNTDGAGAASTVDGGTTGGAAAASTVGGGTAAGTASLDAGASMPSADTTFLEKNSAVIARLAAYAASKNVTFCLKNEFWSLVRGQKLADYVKSIRSQYPDAPVMIDADTANLAIVGTDPAAFIREQAGLIGAVHFSDTAFVDDCGAYASPSPEFPAGRATQIFKDLGQGNVDFPDIYKALETMDFKGPVVINAKQTRDFSRALLRARYYIDHTLEAK